MSLGLFERPMLPFELQKLASRPEVDKEMELILDCWRDLDSCRPMGTHFTLAIPFDAIQGWAELEQLDYDDFRLLVETIQILDHDRIERLVSKVKKPPPKGRR